MRLAHVMTAAVMVVATGAAEARTQVRVVGSSTVYPFTTAVAEQFKRRFPQFEPPIVESTGTGGGIKLFCGGVGTQHPDIANASRRIKASEVAMCAKNGVTQVVEIQVGLDGIALAQAKKGRGFSVSSRDVYAAVAANPFGKPQTAKTWRDVNPKLPAVKIEMFGPPPTSGTRDAFAELILEKGCESDPAMKALKASDEGKFKSVCTKVREDGPYVQAGENDNLIVQKLVANPTAVGVFGFSYLEENLDKLKDVPLDGVPATYANVASFKYPASRPLYIYVKAQHARAVRGLTEFVGEYAKDSAWGPKGYLVSRGLVASPDRVRAANAKVAAAMTPMKPGAVK